MLVILGGLDAISMPSIMALLSD